jgi:hypothetical protein
MFSEQAIVDAFLLAVDRQLKAYDWAWVELNQLCHDKPDEAYDCVRQIIFKGTFCAVSAVGCSSLKVLIENSPQILSKLVADLKKYERFQYAFASAAAFGIYPGNIQTQELLADLLQQYDIRKLYEHLCDYSKSLEKIYIKLVDEGTEVFLPANAYRLGENLYRIEQSKAYESEDQLWEFSPGAEVYVEPKKLSTGVALVAISQKPVGDSSDAGEF